MGIFGSKADPGAVQALIDRLGALPLDALAQEVLGAVVGFDDLPMGAQGPTAYEVAEHLAGGKVKAAQLLELAELVAEGLQQLEHASLVRPSVGLRNESYDLQYVLTRAGRTSLGAGRAGR